MAPLDGSEPRRRYPKTIHMPGNRGWRPCWSGRPAPPRNYVLVRPDDYHQAKGPTRRWRRYARPSTRHVWNRKTNSLVRRSSSHRV